MRTLTIAATAVQISPDWSFNASVTATATMSFSIADVLTLTEINVGDVVLFTDGGSTKYFSGLIASVEAAEQDGELIYTCTVANFNRLAAKRLIAQTATAQTDKYIIDNYILPILADEGITSGSVETGYTLDTVVFNRISCEEAMNYLSTISGFAWYIDEDRKLYYQQPTSNLSPFNISDSSRVLNFTHIRSNEQYRNRQYAKGGKSTTSAELTESPTPKPDGVSREFFVSLPIALEPTITINGTPVSSADVGIRGLDDGMKWYWAYGSNQISQDDSETVLSSTDVFTSVEYYGLFTILVYAENPDEIAARAAAEQSTSGIYESVAVEPSITDTLQAVQYNTGLLNKYGEIADRITFTTYTAGLKEGQLIEVVRTLFGINSTFLITAVNASAFSPDIIAYEIEAIDGAALGGWEEYFRQLLDNRRDFSIANDEVLISLLRNDESIVNAGELNITGGSYGLYPGAALTPAAALVPERNFNTEVTLYD